MERKNLSKNDALLFIDENNNRIPQISKNRSYYPNPEYFSSSPSCKRNAHNDNFNVIEEKIPYFVSKKDFKGKSLKDVIRMGKNELKKQNEEKERMIMMAEEKEKNRLWREYYKKIQEDFVYSIPTNKQHKSNFSSSLRHLNLKHNIPQVSFSSSPYSPSHPTVTPLIPNLSSYENKNTSTTLANDNEVHIPYRNSPPYSIPSSIAHLVQSPSPFNIVNKF
jgi:hypothetical protein